ncbi:tetratricopeptide repeat protein [Roseobacter sp. YSTF-M11]|uniref:Tetratricopeptide repeat protein n=1 Tax=Roseobacter insulae TaxID=2859783 RepID=A0A9X1K2D7_9RHOB|nr:tetratricopeptide repeat protein [Roseobacter insulae]MBW4707472.1 tetratricopeptide repeat protein [Roseobacter insulae]
MSNWDQSTSQTIRDQLHRILDSDVFAHGERQSRFLRYIVEAALEGRERELSQYAVGIDVFDKNETFDPTTDSIVRVEAGRLRSKLAEYYAHPGLNDRTIISLPKGGYAPMIEFVPTRMKLPETRPDRPSALSDLTRPVLAALVVAGLAMGAWFYGTSAPPGNPPQDAGAGKPSIAVLPFDNMSTDEDQEYFSDGISEDIITDLSVLSNLRVIARHSTFVYKDRPASIREIGSDLGVHYVLEGSVRRDAGRLRINAQLIDVETEAHVWAERFDRDLTDLFEIQDEVSARVIAALEIALSDQEAERLVHRNTRSLEAHDLFLRGQESFYGFDPSGVREAIALFARATEADPGYAEAYAWQARALTFAFIAGYMPSKLETVDRALALSAKAIEIDAALPMAHANLAWALRWDRQLERAAEVAEKAVALDPNFADGFLWQSLILSSMDEGQGAVEAIDRGFELNPSYSVTYIFALGFAYFAQNDFEAALAQFRRGIRRNPNFLPTALYEMFTLEKLGRTKEARQAHVKLQSTHPRYRQSASYHDYVDP